MSVLPHYCRARKATQAEQPRTTVCLSRPSFGLLVPEAPGVICLLSLDYGIACINALPGAHDKVCGIACSPNWHKTQILKKYSSTAPSCEHISTQLGRQKNGNQALGRSRGGLSTKIHALVEGLGSLARFSLTGGEAGDSPQALPLIKDLRPGSLSADKAYDSDAIIEHLTAEGIEAVIPPRSNRLVQRFFDKHRYKNRNLVERFFCRIKQFRRIATRYDKLAARFASFIALVASVIWLA